MAFRGTKPQEPPKKGVRFDETTNNKENTRQKKKSILKAPGAEGVSHISSKPEKKPMLFYMESMWSNDLYPSNYEANV